MNKKLVMRTFVAAEISNKKVLSSIEKVQKDMSLNATPISIQNMHFTMMFLGEIYEEMIQKVQDALNSIKFSPFKIKFEGVGTFPNPRFPRIVWMGVDKSGGMHLSNLAVAVQKALLPLGFKNDKPFKPHLTIFRIKNKIGNVSDKLAKFNQLHLGEQTISEIKLKKSILTPNGPIYSDLQVVKAIQ